LIGDLRALLVPVAGSGLVSLELIAPAGALHEPPARAGLALVTAHLLDEGSQQRSSRQLSAAVETLGGHLHASGDWNRALVSIGVGSEELQQGLNLLAEVVGRPAFAAESVETVVRRARLEAARRAQHPASLAARSLDRALFPGGRQQQPVGGDPDSLATLTAREIVEFHRCRYRAGGLTLVAVGDFAADRLLQAAERTFDSLLAGFPGNPRTTEPARRQRSSTAATPQRDLIRRPDALQTDLLVGARAVEPGHPDHLALTLCSCLLGGQFSSRLNLDLRERAGVTYRVRSRLQQRLSSSVIAISSSVERSAAAKSLAAILEAIERLCEEPVTPQELDATCGFLAGSWLRELETVDSLADVVADLATFDLAPNGLGDRFAALEAITPESLRQAASRHLRVDRWAIVAVGPEPPW
jgi:zinc protease